MSPASPNDQSLTVLLDDLRRAGIELHAEDGRLRFRAPRGALTPELRERLTVHRDEILERLQRKDRPLLKAHPEDAEAPFPLTDIQTSQSGGAWQRNRLRRSRLPRLHGDRVPPIWIPSALRTLGIDSSNGTGCFVPALTSPGGNRYLRRVSEWASGSLMSAAGHRSGPNGAGHHP